MRRIDWLLLTLAAAGGGALSPVQLQKVLFVLGQRAPVGEGFYEFRPYHYGPFSAAIYVDAEKLEAAGLATIDRSEPGRAWPSYSATPEGLNRAERVASTVPNAMNLYVRRLVQWARSLSFSELVSAIYRDFPEQRVNSVFSG